MGTTNGSCAYVGYCAYHSFLTLNGQPVIYANIPYGNSFCQIAGQTTPNDAFADLAANMTGYEIMQAVTDPLFNAWFDSSGAEISLLCNFTFGSNTWGSGATADAHDSANVWRAGGKVIGAIGVSGGTGSQDDVVSQAGVAALQ